MIEEHLSENIKKTYKFLRINDGKKFIYPDTFWENS